MVRNKQRMGNCYNLYYVPVFPLVFYIQENNHNLEYTLTLESSTYIERLKNKTTHSTDLQV